MKYLRKQNLSDLNLQDHTILKEASGNIQLNPVHRVVLNGDLEINGDLSLPPGASIPGPEVTNVMYVTLDGNDHNSGFGEGPGQAKRTIKSAVDAAQQGTTIFVRSGEYEEFNPIRIPPKVSIIGDNLRRTIIRPLNGPRTINIVNVERTNQVTTITTDVPHGLDPENRIRVRAELADDSTENSINETDVNITEVPTPTTLKYRQAGGDISSQSAGGVIKWAPDLFLVNSQNYITGVVFKGLQAPAYCVNIDDDAIVDTSPYVQNCSNINGPWMRNGEEWLPFITKQPDLNGNFVTGPRPLLDNEIDPTQIDVYGIDPEGAGGGMLIDGDRYNDQSPIKSMVGDAFTQVAQGGIGFHITNFGYMQLVSCFAVFCSKGFYTSRGGYLSISNSVIDFGDEGFVADGYYLDPYGQGKVAPDFYSTVGSVTISSEGAGFTSIPTITIDPPDPNVAGARQATAEANIDPILGVINGISITDSGFGYDFVPDITITPDNGAFAIANLTKNLTIDLVEVSNKPQVGSIMFLGDDPDAYYISGTSFENQPFKYDEQKCRRDVNLIVQAVVDDMIFGTNYKSVQAGLSYLRSYSSKVTSLQKTETLSALQEAKTLTIAATSDNSAKTIIGNNFDIVIDILDSGISAAPTIITPAPVSADPGYPEAAAILQANKLFIQDEIIAWISQEYPFEYDQAKFSQDIGTILDAVLSDLIFGTNYQSRAVAFSYVRSYNIEVTTEKKTQIIDGINKARDLATILIEDDEAIQVIKDNFKIITDVIFDTNPQRAPALTYSDPINTDVGVLNGADQLVINRNFLVSEIVAYVNDNLDPELIPDYDESTCARDTGYVIDAVTYDLLYGGNSATISAALAYFINDSNVIDNQIVEHIDAFTRLKDIIGFIIEANNTWTKSVSNTAVQDINGASGSASATSTAESLLQVFLNIIASDSSPVPETVVEPTYQNGTNYAFRNDSRLVILDNKSIIQEETIQYINETYTANFSYDDTTCKRDIGYIIDAISYDLIYGGGSQARLAGLSYAEGSVIAGEIEETQAAYEYWKEISTSIIKNIAIVPTTGNAISQNVSLPLGSPSDPSGPAAKVARLLQIIIDVIDHGPGYVPEIPEEPLFDTYGDSALLSERTIVLDQIPSIQDSTINFINTTYSGSVTVSVFPAITSVVRDVEARFHNVSTLSSGGTALEYVGAGVTYNALPFFGGEPIPEKERIERNNGKAFTVSSDQVGNFRIGEFFTVNALTGEVTINAENLNLSGLSSIGPFRRNGIPVGVALREVSDNSGLISSTGVADANTVPTQTAVSNFVENRYLNKIQSTTPQTVESDVVFKQDIEIQGGDLTTDQTEFNLLNTTVTTVNFAGDATEINIGDVSGTTNVNNDLSVFGQATIHKADDSTTGNLNTDATAFNILNETVNEINFGNSASSINIGNTSSIVQINDDINVTGDLTTDQTEFNLLNTTATTVNFAGDATTIELGSSTGTTSVNNDLTVDGDTTLGDSGDDTTTVNGSLVVKLADDKVSAFELAETTNSYIKIDTVNSFELVSFGTLPKVQVFNTTDATSKDTGALIVEGGIGVEKNIHIGANLTVDGNTVLGSDRNIDATDIAGIVNIDIPDDTSNVFDIRENLSSYVKIDTTDDNEYVDFGTTPVVRILNITDSTDKDTGALVVEGGIGVERNVTVGVDLTVDRDTTVTRNLAVNGSNLTTNSTTFNLINDNATIVNFAGTATDIQIGSSTGTTNVNNNLDVDLNVNIDGGSLTVSTTTFNLANTSAETVNFAGAATDIQIGSSTGNTNVNNNLIVDLDLEVKGGDIITDQTTFNLINDVATTVNFGGDATDIQIGSSSGATNVNNNLLVDGDLQIEGGDITTDQAEFNILTTGAQTINAFTSATTIEIGAATGVTSINNSLHVDNDVILGSGTEDTVTINGALDIALADNIAGVFEISEGSNSYIRLDTSNSFELISFGSSPKIEFLNLTDATNSSTASVVFNGGVGIEKQLWVGTNLLVDGNTTLGDNRVFDTTTINGTVSVDLPDNTGFAFEINENLTNYITITTTDLLESVDFGTVPQIRILNTSNSVDKDTGALVVNGGIGVEFNITTGLDVNVGRNAIVSNDLAVNGGDLTTTATTFNLINTDATVVNFAGAATTIEIGSSSGTTGINNDLDVDGNINIDGGNITTNLSSINLLNTNATVVNFAGAATAIDIGATTGTTSINNDLDVDGDVNIDGGDLTTNQATFNLLNTNATTVNFASDATDLNIGAATGDTTVNNNLTISGDLTVNGGDISTSLSSINVLNSTVTDINAFGAATTIEIGATNSTVNINGTTESTDTSTGALVIDGGVGVAKNLNVGGNASVEGNIDLTGDITANAFNSSKTALLPPTIGDYTGERVRLYDFENVAKVNYAIGVETSAIWMSVDTNLDGQGFKWYGAETQVMRVSGAGNLELVGNATIDGNIAVDGGNLTTTSTTFNLVNATATTVNFASSATSIEIGAASGITNVNNNLNVDGDFRLGSSVTLFNQGTNGFSVYEDYDIANNGAQTGYTFTSGAGRTSTILGLGVTGEFNNFVGVTGTSTANKLVIGSTSTTTDFEIRNNTGVEPVDITGGNLLFVVSSIGNVSVSGDVEVKGGDLTTDQTEFNLLNTNATTVNFAGDGTDIQIGSSAGTTNINNNLDVDLDVNIDGGDLTTNQLTFNLLNTNATTVNFAGDATDIQIGAATGTTTVNNDLTVFGSAVIAGADDSTSGRIDTTSEIFNLIETNATTVNFAGSATSVNIGSASGDTTVNNNLIVDKDLQVSGGDLTTSQLTFNLLNTTVETVNFGGAANSIIVGSSTSTTTFNNDVTVTGNLTISGTTTTVNTEEIKLADNIITLNANYTGNNPTENSGIEVERGDLTNASVVWDEANGYWTLDNATGTPYIIHHTGRDVELGVETSGNYISTIAGTLNQVNVANSGTETANVVLSLPQDIHSGASPTFVNTTLSGDLAVNGGDLTTTATTFNLVNTTATTFNFAGAATSIDIGAGTGTLTVNNTETIFDSTSHIIIPVGDVAQRPAVPAEGMVRYNTELQTFEGYTSAWGSLGGVKDIDGDTYIVPELSPGSDEDTLYFYNGGLNTATITATSLSLLQNTGSTSTNTGSLIVDGGAGISENTFIGGTLDVTGASTLTSTLDVTGDTTITGDIAVNGGDLTTTSAAFNLINTDATTVNFAGAATTVEIGGSSGTTNVNNNLVVDLDVEIKGGDLTTDQTEFNLLPAAVTIGNLFDVATSVNVSKSASSASTLTVGPGITGNSIILNSTTNGVVNVDSIVSTGTVNLFSGITTGTVNLATTNGCIVNIGGASSTTNIAELALTTDLAVEFGGTGQSTFTENGVVYGNTANGLLVTAASNPGVSNATTSYGILTTDVNNVPTWTDTIDEGEY